MQKVIEISGMSCDHCVAAVRKALDGVDGVSVKEVTIGTAVLETDGSSRTDEQLSDAVENAGYQIVNQTSSSES